ncbi:hypothetical protein LH128_08366 [Sphingomonas sp. LH128]|nr:hypothetical protein LH128_08366 [Sphingomonas sp. LH128]
MIRPVDRGGPGIAGPVTQMSVSGNGGAIRDLRDGIRPCGRAIAVDDQARVGLMHERRIQQEGQSLAEAEYPDIDRYVSSEIIGLQTK